MFIVVLHFTEVGTGGKSGSQGDSSVASGSVASQQQQDWSIVWGYFDNPHKLLVQAGGGLSKAMQDMVRNAVTEMRHYYSRKVVDVLIKVTRQSLDCLLKRFTSDSGFAGWFCLTGLVMYAFCQK
jgi:dynein heavy chain